ncbi:hypothetical protein L7F22_042028 [Adiantum nelumboides]|nr:hypothetical protein [Adiantum nelumboides]
MAANDQSSAIDAVLAALDTLYKNPDNSAKQQANTWLQNFQKTPEAWQTANALLLSQDLPLEPRLFAAQTFRVKSTYDIDQIPRETLPSLRATLITALQAYKSGPKVIQTQISLALSGLALQLRDGEDPEWGDHVVRSMIDTFGKDPSDVATLLEFLTVLPEEVNMNQRIPVNREHYNTRTISLLQTPARDVLEVLSVYIQAQGLTETIQASVFACLASWLKSGEIDIQTLMQTPLFTMSFDCLTNEQLFDGAVDVVCDIINETQEVQDNQEAIQIIIARLLPLRAELQQAISDGDDDKVRGLCRVFVQAGEVYHSLMIPHKDAFFPIAEAIFACAAYTDLDIVQITFRFWYFLTGDLQRNGDDGNAYAYASIYQQLLEAIVKHLRFPDEMDSWSGQERDDFKAFRHVMGDTLKDCCQVLGSQTCLARSLGMIQEVLTNAQGGSAKWQDVEAPLFSMRAMGAQADPRDDEILPQIMNIIPELPSHPRLTYAALLVISRYTEWVKYHPDRIPMILSYISAGFQTTDLDVTAAAAQAFKYLGEDCDVELAPFLPQLFDFYQAVVERVDPQDGRSIAEAIGYVIAALPVEQATEPLMQFTQPLLQSLSAVANAEASSVVRADLQKAADRMEQIDAMLKPVSSKIKPPSLPPSCSSTCKQAFDIIDTILVKHGSIFFVAERACELLRRGLAFFDFLAIPVAPALLERMANSFEVTGFPSFIWIAGKAIDTFGQRSANFTPELERPMGTAFERISVKVNEMINSANESGKSIIDMPDVIDDYIHACAAVAEALPGQLILSGAFPASFQIAVNCLQQMYQVSILEAILDYLRIVVGHDALEQNAGNGFSQSHSRLDPQVASQYANAIRSVLQEQGAALVSALLQGTVTTFEPETLPDTTIVLRLLAVNVTGFQALQSWFAAGLAGINDSIISQAEKQKCMTTLSQGESNSIKPALQGIYSASRKSRERDRLDRQSNLLDQ